MRGVERSDRQPERATRAWGNTGWGPPAVSRIKLRPKHIRSELISVAAFWPKARLLVQPFRPPASTKAVHGRPSGIGIGGSGLDRCLILRRLAAGGRRPALSFFSAMVDPQLLQPPPLTGLADRLTDHPGVVVSSRGGEDSRAHIGMRAGQGCSGGQGRQLPSPGGGGLDWRACPGSPGESETVLARISTSVRLALARQHHSACRVACRRIESVHADLRAFWRGKLPRWIRHPGWPNSRPTHSALMAASLGIAGRRGKAADATWSCSSYRRQSLRCSAVLQANWWMESLAKRLDRARQGWMHQGLAVYRHTKRAPPTARLRAATGVMESTISLSTFIRGY